MYLSPLILKFFEFHMMLFGNIIKIGEKYSVRR